MILPIAVNRNHGPKWSDDKSLGVFIGFVVFALFAFIVVVSLP